jgi:YD repeat-containing protein
MRTNSRGLTSVGFRLTWLATLFTAGLLGTGQAFAQAYLTTIGDAPFTAAAPVENGAVNLANGNLHIEIPLGSAQQRGRYGFSARLVYDSRIWQVVTGSSTTWQPTNVANSQGGWRLVTSADVGSVNAISDSSGCGQNGCTVTLGSFTWTDSMGTSRAFPTVGFTVHPCGGAQQTSGYATDSSGFYMVATMTSTCSLSEVIYARDGTQVYPQLKDPNGNYFSTDGNGNVIDTLGRTQVTKTTNGSTTYYDVINSQGSTSRFTVATATVNVNTAFGQSGVTEYSGNFSAIQSITLPDNTSYSFTYDSGTTSGNFGLLKTMTIPATGQVTYGFTTFQDSAGFHNRWLNTRTSQTGTWSGTWTYTPAVITTCTWGQSTCKQKVTITQPTNDYVVHTFNLDSAFNGAWDTQQQTYDSSNNLMMTGTVTYDFSHSGSNIVPLSTQLTMPVPGSSSISRQTKYVYDSSLYPNGNVTAVKEWGWYAGTSPSYPTTPDRETDTTYVTNYGNSITNLPSTVTVNGTSGMVSQTKISYDDSTHLTAKTGVVNHDDTNFSTSNNVRGNPTLIQGWVSGTTYLPTNIYYDTTGQVTKKTDPANNSVTYQRGDDKFFTDNGANPPATFTPTVTTNAYVTQVTLPIVGSKTYGYYFKTGKGAFAKDQNGSDVYRHFLDPLDRATHTYGPVVNGNRAWSMAAYSGQTQVDVYRTRTDTTPSTNCTNCVHGQHLTDGLRRGVKSMLMSDPEGTIKRDITYDAKGRVQSASNRYRSTTESTYGTVQPAYDALNRSLGITQADGNVRQVSYGDKVSTNGLSSQLCSASTYGLGYPVLTMDEAGNKRQNWKDGFGRLIEVDEPDPSTNSLTLNTCYAYDAANHLKTIVQGSQTRSFVHDSLGRITSKTLPESGTTTFAYLNSSGQVCAGDGHKICSMTDARGVTRTFTYDALNRMTSKTYSDSTPTITYYYDQTSFNGLTITNGTGRRTGMKETSGSTVLGQTAWSFDAAGRVLAEQKTVGTITKTISYSYNLDGTLASVTYPSGHTVSYGYSNAGKAISAVDTTSNINYVQGATFAPHGKLSGAVYGQVSGGFTGITRTRTYNNRLQDTRITDASSNGTVKDLSYSHDLGSGVNNGLIAKMTDNVVVGRTQNYVYDHLKRITSATTQATSGSDCWGQTHTRDRYNNLTNVAVSQCTAPTLSVTVDPTTNHITTYTYDPAGHVTNDGAGHTYSWDAEHRLSSGGGVNYLYDGLGRRVQKSSGELSWYDAQGNLLATTNSSGNPISEYIYFGGRRIARREASGSVLYYFNDTLNTDRTMTDASGVVQQMSEYYPTGGEKLLVGSVSNVMKFSGNALDSETSLYASPGAYQPSTGTVLAPVASSGASSNPQNLNPYSGLGQQIGQQMGQMSNSYSAGAGDISGGFSGQGECDDMCYDIADSSNNVGNYTTNVGYTTPATNPVSGGSVAAPSGGTDTGTSSGTGILNGVNINFDGTVDPAPPSLSDLGISSQDAATISAIVNAPIFLPDGLSGPGVPTLQPMGPTNWGTQSDPSQNAANAFVVYQLMIGGVPDTNDSQVLESVLTTQSQNALPVGTVVVMTQDAPQGLVTDEVGMGANPASSWSFTTTQNIYLQLTPTGETPIVYLPLLTIRQSASYNNGSYTISAGPYQVSGTAKYPGP